MTLQNELLLDLIESNADVNIFCDREKDNFRAKNAGIILTSNAVGHFPKRRGDKYTVWFGRGVARLTFKTFKDAVKKIAEILQKAEIEIQYRFEGKEIKRFNREFARVYSKEASKCSRSRGKPKRKR